MKKKIEGMKRRLGVERSRGCYPGVSLVSLVIFEDDDFKTSSQVANAHTVFNILNVTNGRYSPYCSVQYCIVDNTHRTMETSRYLLPDTRGTTVHRYRTVHTLTSTVDVPRTRLSKPSSNNHNNNSIR